MIPDEAVEAAWRCGPILTREDMREALEEAVPYLPELLLYRARTRYEARIAELEDGIRAALAHEDDAPIGDAMLDISIMRDRLEALLGKEEPR